MKHSIIERALIVSGLPHPWLASDRNEGWKSLAKSYRALGEKIQESDADLILYFSTQWPSVIGYLFQANPRPEWTHVDHEWHEFGSIPYSFRIDSDFASAYADEVRGLGYNAATVNYFGFPIDTGSIVAQKFLNPSNRLPATMVSCGLYAEKEETLQIGRAAGRALAKTGKRAIAVLVTSLSHRFFTHDIDPKTDHISSAKDDEWNRKILELLGQGRLEDVSQVARDFAREANGDMNFKGIWWLAGLCGESNLFRGKIYDYQAVWGTGNTLVELLPTEPVLPRPDPESDLYDGEGKIAPDPTILPASASAPVAHKANKNPDSAIVRTSSAAEPVGPYPHARREGELIFVSGMGPREPGKREIPGVTLNEFGEIATYDIETQTRSTIRNIEAVLRAAGASLANVIDVQVFLTNMKVDFARFNQVYGEYFGAIAPTRTTIEVRSLPTPIAVELKVIARVRENKTD